jgi:superfamily I DNA/RNA helicase
MTEKQLRVAMGTVSKRSWDQILLAGDPTQVLNGSGFEWRIPRALFYERTEEVPASKTLTRSFRAGAPTLRLPEALAERLREEGADVVSLDPEQARTTGNRPVRIPPGESVDEVLSRGHPDVLVLTADPETASTLQKKWGHPFIWTVSEAKGLEADHVVLYDLPDRLRSIPGTKPSQREAAKRKSQYHLRLHYVTQVAGYG